MAVQKTLIKSVVGNVDFLLWNAEQVPHFLPGEVRNGDDPGGMLQGAARELEVQEALHTGLLAGADEMLQDVVDGDHVRTRQGAWKPD